MASTKSSTQAVAYLRTSSQANVGADKDSDKRQRAAIAAFAKANGYELAGEYYDPGISGADPVTARPGFNAMLERLLSNGVRTIIVESPDRFARDLTVQLLGHDHLKANGITLIAASAPNFFMEETPTAVLVRQVLGAIAQFDRATTVAKLKAARDRKREAGHKVEGRKSHAEKNPEVVKAARALARRKAAPSLRQISAELALAGFVNERGVPFNPKSIAAMLPVSRSRAPHQGDSRAAGAA